MMPASHLPKLACLRSGPKLSGLMAVEGSSAFLVEWLLRRPLFSMSTNSSPTRYFSGQDEHYARQGRKTVLTTMQSHIEGSGLE